MKPAVYCIVLLLIIPVQASLFNPISLAGVKPDLSLVIIYVIGLLTSPTEGTVAGMGIGIMQDVSSAGLIGMAGFTRGLFGLCAGLLGRRVLDISSPSNIVFLGGFCIAEGIVTALLMHLLYGAVPFAGLFITQILPQALYTTLLGIFVIRLMNSKQVMNRVRRRSLRKE